MRRQFHQLQRNPSAMEIELSRQSSSTNDDQPRIDPRYSGLQITRDRKRTSERQEIAEIRRQARLSEPSTSSGIIPETLSETIPEERYAPERQDSTDSDQLQLLSPHRSDPTNQPGGAGESANWIENVGINNDHAHQHHMNPISFLTGLLGGISNLPTPPQNGDQPSPSESNASENGVQSSIDVNMGRFPHGAIVVRTVQPGPNGSIIVRMRVISLDELIGRQGGENNNNNENQPGQPGQEGPMSLFGTLMGLLGGFPGAQERGLDKEALEGLPLVKYDNEMFKNVEEESKSCPICLEHFEDGNEVRFLWCIHRFHKNCVDQWLEKHTTCPICKKDYSEAEKASFE